jgi:Family of unknown function (DUF5947)
MTRRAPAAASPRLRRLAQRTAPKPATEERCDLCGREIPSEHRHLVNLESRQLLCACKACSLLFDRAAAGGGHFRLVPDRRLEISDFELLDEDWDALAIPVDMAFFFRPSGDGGVQAFYPGPMGATESTLTLTAWERIESANPVLAEMEPDVEALLVNRARGSRRYWLVPIDDCYSLVGLIRTGWKGLSGGREVWQEIERYFEELDRRSRRVNREGARNQTTVASNGGGEETQWQISR